MNKIICLLFCFCVSFLANAQKFSDSLLLHVPTNANISDMGPGAYPSTPISVTYTSDYRTQLNQAIACNGSSTKISYATAGTKFQHALPMTISVWVNLSSMTGNNPVFYGADNYIKYAGVWLQIIDGYIYANVGDNMAAGFGNRYSVRSANTIAANTWNQVTAVFRSSGLIDLYINGVKDAATVPSGNSITMQWNSTANASYGFASSGPGTFNYFNGKLDNLMVWGRALTEAEIRMNKDLIYFGELGSSILDLGPTLCIPTKTGTAAEFDRMGNNGGGIVFNGTADKLVFPANATYKPTFPFTISAWVYSESSSGIRPILATTDHSAGVYSGASLWLENGFPTLYIGDGTCNGSTCRSTYTSGTAAPTSQWNLITATASNITTIKIYINGVAVTNGVLSGSGSTMNNNSAIAGTIGYLTDAYSISNKYFSGVIDEVFMVNSALSAADIATLYTKSIYLKQQPVSVSVTKGATTSLLCQAAGTSTMTYQWQKLNAGNVWGSISGANQNVLHFASVQTGDTGTYRCQASGGGLQITTVTATVSLLPSTGLENGGKHFYMYPNPVTSVLHISLPNPNKALIQVIDLHGKELQRLEFQGDEFQLDTEALCPGTYFIQCTTFRSFTYDLFID